jgi:hypothetical protein
LVKLIDYEVSWNWLISGSIKQIEKEKYLPLWGYTEISDGCSGDSECMLMGTGRDISGWLR